MVSKIAKGAAILSEAYEPLAAEPDQPLGKLTSSLENNWVEVTPYSQFAVPEVLEDHVVPLSDEVRIVPLCPTATNVPFPNVTLFNAHAVPA